MASTAAPAKAPSTALVRAETLSPSRKASITGTVTKILSDGQGRRQFRAYVQTADGQTVRVVSKQPLPVSEMADLRLNGQLRVSPDPMVAHDLVVTLPDQSKSPSRLQKIMQGGGEIKSFGATTQAAKRPAMLAWMRTCAEKIGVFTPRENVTVMASTVAAEQDKVLKGLTRLFDGASHTDTMAFIDPAAFAPGITGKRGQIRKTAKALPLAMASITRQADFREAFGVEARAFTLSPAPGACRKHRRHVVLGFPTVETGLSFFQKQTGLTVQRFVPRVVGGTPDARRYYEGARTAARLLAREYGIKLPRTRHQAHFQECFADAFAIMATQRFAGSAPCGESYAQWREAAALTGPISQATGRTARAAATWGRANFSNGVLHGMGTRDLLQKAADLAEQHALSIREMREIRTLRERIATLEGITLDDDFAVPLRKSGVYVSRLARNTRIFTDEKTARAMPLMQTALQHIAEGCYRPSELRDPKVQQKLLDRYRNDVNNTVLYGGKLSWKTKALMTHERKMHGFNAEAVNWRAASSRYQPPGWAPSNTLSGKRLALIDLLAEQGAGDPPPLEAGQAVTLARPA